MILRKLILRNFGLYRGEQTIDLAPRTRRGKVRPIVLVGGHNGAGKTTILDAVRLCLFGRLAIAARVTDADYHVYLRDHIYRPKDALIPLSYASVSLEFDYAQAGRPSVYFVQRAWEPKGQNGVTESLRVLRDGEPLADVESQFWPEFIRTLVPPGVAQLFFFDGERIKRFAEEESEAGTLSESIKALLGLDLVERLQADLDVYSARNAKKTATGSLATRLAELDSAEESFKSELGTQVEAQTDLRARLAEIAVQLDRTEQRLALRGEGISTQRSDLRIRIGSLDSEREQQERSLRELCDGALPFVFCPTVASSLLKQLDAEAQREHWDASRSDIAQALEIVRKKVANKKFATKLHLDEAATVAISKEIQGIAAELASPPQAIASIKPIHGMSVRARQQAERALAEALELLPTQVGNLTLALSRTIEALRDAQGQLNRAPHGEEMAPMVRELSTLQQEHAALTLEVTIKTEQREKIERDLSALERERLRLVRTQEDAQAALGRLSLAGSARRALDDYLTRLTTAKVDELQVAALSCFQTLSRKTDLVHDLRIDPTSFTVTLMSRNGETIPKASLSAGEKQIYAISLLWALAKVSGRSLPMIVDTPLGRLDAVHRQHLLARYFPVASHQVVILSTDTEVDKDSLKTLKPYTSHAVHLLHKEGWTQVSAGYFWNEEPAGV